MTVRLLIIIGFPMLGKAVFILKQGPGSCFLEILILQNELVSVKASRWQSRLSFQL